MARSSELGNSALIAWAPIEGRGYDACSLSASASGWRLEGALWLKLGEDRLSLKYRVLCDSRWATRAVHLEQEWLGRVETLQLTSDNFQHWWIAGRIRPDLEGCFDVDLSLSPSTNTLPIRRLDLKKGEDRQIDVVWIRTPPREITRARQSYQRLAKDMYRFRSLDSGAEALIRIREDGLVVDYPDGWALASSDPGVGRTLPIPS